MVSEALIRALEETAERLFDGAEYRWTHQGACNCGHLAQTVTRLSAAELHAAGLEKPGDWSEHAREYCPTSGYPIDTVVSALIGLGLSTDDLANLERLADPAIVARVGRGALDFRRRADVVAYMLAWAAMLREALPRAPARANAVPVTSD